ncbi:hypothetical protein NAC44_18040 [Allorhizobium sp. BGMRC 0089]|uniref:hypothetical protein n=1 Tax=Allorhizobium sonneratiae TaxID=2934936 RepID=UPI002033D270|nr:hypothetical protein [Allorhizobium sonneratiae]MCM2294231.1 hypothetical protein [Allorhizobium sonneratiae]
MIGVKNDMQTQPICDETSTWRPVRLVLMAAAAILGALLYIGFTRSIAPSRLSVHEVGVERRAHGWQVLFEGRNRTDDPIRTVDVRGVLMQRGQPVEASEVTVTDVSSKGTFKGRLDFTTDPRGRSLRLNAMNMFNP